MTDEEIRALFEDFRTALESKLSDFEFDVERLFDHGEYEAAILQALMTSGYEGVPVPDELIDRAAQLFRRGAEHELFVIAVNRIRNNAAATA